MTTKIHKSHTGYVLGLHSRMVEKMTKGELHFESMGPMLSIPIDRPSRSCISAEPGKKNVQRILKGRPALSCHEARELTRRKTCTLLAGSTACPPNAAQTERLPCTAALQLRPNRTVFNTASVVTYSVLSSTTVDGATTPHRCQARVYTRNTTIPCIIKKLTTYEIARTLA